jgi:excisionase family DNA binding protein
MLDHDTPQWMTLSEAAHYIGVHPSTLRDWAERGVIPHLRTPGGHRRFIEDDLRAYVASNRHTAASSMRTGDIADRALQRIQHDVPTDATWINAHDAAGIEHKREIGRRLLGLALHYISRQTGREAVLAEAREIGRDYGRDALQRGITLVEVVRAFFFFRDAIVRAAHPSETTDRLDTDDGRLQEDLIHFTDAVLFAMLETIDTGLRGVPLA